MGNYYLIAPIISDQDAIAKDINNTFQVESTDEAAISIDVWYDPKVKGARDKSRTAAIKIKTLLNLNML